MFESWDQSNWVQVYVGLVIGVLLMLWQHVRNKKSESLEEKAPTEIFLPRGYTAEELVPFDGVSRKQIFIGVRGIIYKVAAEWYGPDGPYHAFAGCEASRQLGKTKVGRDEINADWTCLSPEHLETLREWHDRFVMKYQAVGWFVPDDHYQERGRKFDP